MQHVNNFSNLSSEAQKMYADMVKTNLNAMSSILVLMMNQSRGMANGDLNLASSSVVQAMLMATEKLISSLLQEPKDYAQAIKQCETFFASVMRGEKQDDDNG